MPDNISKLPQTPKNPEKKWTDAPKTYDPDAAGGDKSDSPNANKNDDGSIDSKNTNIHW